MPKIFVSYRRADSSEQTERIHDRLVKAFGLENVFLDVERGNIPTGADFAQVLSVAVANCDVVLVVIGTKWLDIREDTNPSLRRLDNPNDFVRIEVETALQTKKIVMPVLVGGAAPIYGDKLDLLPNSLKPLTQLQFTPIRRNPDFHDDVSSLIQDIKARTSKTTNFTWWLAGLTAVLAVFVLGSMAFFSSLNNEPLATATPANPRTAAAMFLTASALPTITATEDADATVGAILTEFMFTSTANGRATIAAYTPTSEPSATANETLTQLAVEIESSSIALAATSEVLTQVAQSTRNAPTNTSQPTPSSTPSPSLTPTNLPSSTPNLAAMVEAATATQNAFSTQAVEAANATQTAIETQNAGATWTQGALNRNANQTATALTQTARANLNATRTAIAIATIAAYYPPNFIFSTVIQDFGFTNPLIAMQTPEINASTISISGDAWIEYRELINGNFWYFVRDTFGNNSGWTSTENLLFENDLISLYTRIRIPYNETIDSENLNLIGYDYTLSRANYEIFITTQYLTVDGQLWYRIIQAPKENEGISVYENSLNWVLSDNLLISENISRTIPFLVRTPSEHRMSIYYTWNSLSSSRELGTNQEALILGRYQSSDGAFDRLAILTSSNVNSFIWVNTSDFNLPQEIVDNLPRHVDNLNDIPTMEATTISSTNIRNEPSSLGSIILTGIRENTIIKVYAVQETLDDTQNPTWYLIAIPNRTNQFGWVSGNFIVPLEENLDFNRIINYDNIPKADVLLPIYTP